MKRKVLEKMAQILGVEDGADLGHLVNAVERRKVEVKKTTFTFALIAEIAGFRAEANGKFNLPPTQEIANALAKAIADTIGTWEPGEPRQEVVLTGAAPVWAYLAIAHALHGRCVRLTYSAPNAEIIIWSHGV